MNDPTVVPGPFRGLSEIAVDCLHTCHRAWLWVPGARGRQRNDGDMRRLLPDYSKEGQVTRFGPGWLEPHRNAWALLRDAAAKLAIGTGDSFPRLAFHQAYITE